MNLNHIWAQYSAELKAFIHSRLSNPTDAEDVLQEVAIKAHENLATLKKTDRAKSWLFQIANRAVIDQYRQNGKAQNLHPNDLWYGKDHSFPNIGLDGCMAQMIESLPNDVSQLLADVELGGVSQKAYAKDANIPYSTLKSQVKRAREQLRHRFDQCCSFDFDAFGSVIDFQPKTECCS